MSYRAEGRGGVIMKPLRREFSDQQFPKLNNIFILSIWETLKAAGIR